MRTTCLNVTYRYMKKRAKSHPSCRLDLASPTGFEPVLPP